MTDADAAADAEPPPHVVEDDLEQAELIESLLRHQAAANTRAIATQERTAVATEVAAKNAKLEASK